MSEFDTPVLVIGGGPTGLCLAMDLAWRGTRCLLVEQREARIDHPKATLLGARSMEQLRRWNLEGEIYENCLPCDLRYRISFVTGMNGDELLRFESPSIDDVQARSPEAIKRWPELAYSPYGKTQIGQQAFEPILFRHARRMPGLDILEGWQLTHFTQDRDSVTSHLKQSSTGATRSVRSRYMIGCDGGGSLVRRALGIRFGGRGAIRPNVTFQFRSDGFLSSHPMGPGNLFYVLLPDTFGVFMAINGKDLWGYQYYFLDPKQKTENPDAEAVLHRAVGKPFKFELLSVTHWQHHQSVAEHYRAGNVFLCGDSAHLFSPTGGVGMNTAINDAFDLSWKLHAALSGWGGEWLLQSYESERRPVAIRNTQRAASNSDKNDMIMAEVVPELIGKTRRGELLRADLSQKLSWVAGQYDSAGVHLGYRYQKSNICCPEETVEPPDDYRYVAQSTYPGFRAPHVWMSDGRSTLDLFGKDFVLVCFDGKETACGDLIRAFDARGIPLVVQPIGDEAVRRAYEAALVLVRPDGHVAWRGNEPPADPLHVVDRVRGALRPRFVPDWASAEEFSRVALKD